VSTVEYGCKGATVLTQTRVGWASPGVEYGVDGCSLAYYLKKKERRRGVRGATASKTAPGLPPRGPPRVEKGPPVDLRGPVSVVMIGAGDQD
jgi:hypothetical protein